MYDFRCFTKCKCSVPHDSKYCFVFSAGFLVLGLMQLVIGIKCYNLLCFVEVLSDWNNVLLQV